MLLDLALDMRCPFEAAERQRIEWSAIERMFYREIEMLDGEAITVEATTSACLWRRRASGYGRTAHHSVK